MELKSEAAKKLPQYKLVNSALDDILATPYVLRLAHSKINSAQSESSSPFGSAAAFQQFVASANSDLVIKLFNFQEDSGELTFVSALRGRL